MTLTNNESDYDIMLLPLLGLVPLCRTKAISVNELSNLTPRGPESQPPRGPESQPPRGPESQPPRGPESQPPRGPESLLHLDDDDEIPRGPESLLHLDDDEIPLPPLLVRHLSEGCEPYCQTRDLSHSRFDDGYSRPQYGPTGPAC